MHKSFATISSPEFINLQPLEINPLMSKCEIKVLYVGGNRNGSYITKEVATEMSKTLRGAPIVGHYRDEKEDFTDHGEQVIFDDEGIKFNCLTKPYGFVSPDAKVWFQEFEDEDEFGNKENRTYLMTTGYLWTKQFPECNLAVKEGRPHSMELDPDSMDGHWATDKKTGLDFFIINDAIFSKLCILGEDVEPCFEGSSVTAPNISTSFTKIDKDFKNTLYSMMQDLKNFALQGGNTMENETGVEEEGIVTEPETGDATNTTPAVTEPEATPATAEPAPEAGEGNEFKKDDDEEKDEDNAEKGNEEEKDDEDPKNKHKCDDDEEEKKKYELLNQEHEALKQQYADLDSKYQALVEFKKQVEDAEKDKMIDSFTMLSDEDKADVIENKSKYSLEEIESKLSVICVRKKVNFDLTNNAENHNNTDKPITTFNINSNEGESIPAWVIACENNKNRK